MRALEPAAAPVGSRTGTWILSRPIRRSLQLLLHQQCWCWGADIRRTEGNLLVEYGFVRTPSIGGRDAGSTRYTATVGIGGRVVLWGFGAAYGHVGEEALFLDRYDPAPMLIAPSLLATAHARTDIRGGRLPTCWRSAGRARRRLLQFALWMAGYERWVIETAGAPYRAAVLTEWRSATERDGVDRAWQRLAWEIEQDFRAQALTRLGLRGAREHRAPQAAVLTPRGSAAAR